MNNLKFGDDFKWGIATSALQTEGAYNIDGKGINIWDEFVKKSKSIKNGDHHFKACDFYNRFREDLLTIKLLNLDCFRFSLSWSRILPTLGGKPNEKGLYFYHQIIDFCLELGIEPNITLYHWDLPQYLEKEGGWTNRDIVGRMNDFAEIAVHQYGDKVKTWMPLNEPLVFTTAGYLLGLHAPGKRGLKNYLPAVYNAIRCNAETGRCIKELNSSLKVGSTFSLTPTEPLTKSKRDIKAQARINTALNHLFLDPYLGLDIPTEGLPILKRIDKYRKHQDKLDFKADFIGVQNYTQEVIKHSWFKPYLMADAVPAKKRNVPVSQMNWEIIPEALSAVFKQLNAYSNLPDVYITECGVAIDNDKKAFNKVYDIERIDYLKRTFSCVSKAIEEGTPIKGIYLWTLNDNFEWAEGYYPKFGIIEIDKYTQKRTLKCSAQWLKDFLVDQKQAKNNMVLNERTYQQ